MNLICTKTRNRLSFETMTKLMFIYINERAMSRAPKWLESTNEIRGKLNSLEKELIALGVTQVNTDVES